MDTHGRSGWRPTAAVAAQTAWTMWWRAFFIVLQQRARGLPTQEASCRLPCLTWHPTALIITELWAEAPLTLHKRALYAASARCVTRNAAASRCASGAAQRGANGIQTKSAQCRARFSSALAAALRSCAFAPGYDVFTATGTGVAPRNIVRGLGTCLGCTFPWLTLAVAQSSGSSPHRCLVARVVSQGALHIRTGPMAGRSSLGRAQAACFASAAGCRGAGNASGCAVSMARRLGCDQPNRCSHRPLAGRGILGSERQASDYQCAARRHMGTWVHTRASGGFWRVHVLWRLCSGVCPASTGAECDGARAAPNDRSGNMVPRALLAFAVAARLFDAAVGAVMCPTPSATNITCFSGVTVSSWPASGGSCSCLCGFSTASEDYDYAGHGAFRISTTFVAANAAICTNSACAAKFPVACTRAAVNATWSSWSDIQKAKVSPPTQLAATTQLCISYTYACPFLVPASMGGDGNHTDPCPFGNPGPAMVTTYGGLNLDEQTPCNVIAQTYSDFAAPGGLTICNTANCNAPSSGALAVKVSSFASALVAVAVVALLF